MTGTGKWKRQAGVHLMVGFRGTRLEEDLEGLIRDHRIGGAVLFRRNIEGPEQLRQLVRSAQECALKHVSRPILLAIDQEGGPVQRLTSPPFLRLPSARTLGQEGADSVRRWAAAAGRELRSLGIHINLAPVLDVLPNGCIGHFMEERCLGSHPESVAELGSQWIQALQAEGVSATAKHFPGLGQAEMDPHHHAPVIRWRNESSMQSDLEPFRRAIAGGVHCVMTSHSRYPDLDGDWPATLSPTVCSQWLRQRLGFGGVLLSDDLDMAAVAGGFTWETVARQGLLATIDFFLLCQNPDSIGTFASELAGLLARDDRLAALHHQSLARLEALFRRLRKA